MFEYSNNVVDGLKLKLLGGGGVIVVLKNFGVIKVRKGGVVINCFC